LFWWAGKVDEAAEALLVMKTQKSCLPKIMKAIKLMHTYEVPEMIALPIVSGSSEYLKWIKASTLKRK
jgi:periplasmic divalent cation tolerance protein